MTWQSHAVVGANAVWLLAAFGAVDRYAPVYVAIAAFGALLPDIDAGGSQSKGKFGAKIHYLGKGVLKPFIGVFRHRGFFHSFVFITLLFAMSIPLAFFLGTFTPLMLTTGYASHLLIDQWNGGMQFFYPWKKDVSIVPRAWRFRVGSAGDWAFLFLGAAGLLLFFFVHQDVFFVQTPDIGVLMGLPL